MTRLPLGLPLFLLLLVLTACSEPAKITALEQQLTQLRAQHNQPNKPLETSPSFKQQTERTFIQPQEERDPFSPIITSTKAAEQPNKTLSSKPPEKPTTPLTTSNLTLTSSVLEEWTLTELSFRGSMQRGKTLRALILAPNQQLVSVAQGDRLGKDHGTIIHLDKTSLTVLELISSDTQRQEKTTTINLSR